MAFEDTISSIDTTLKAILVALTTGNAVATQLGEPDKKTSSTKETAAETGKRFAISKDGTAFYDLNGDAVAPTGSKVVDEKTFLAAKAEHAKKLKAAEKQKPAADTALTATAGQDNASGVTFKQVVEGLTALSKDTKEARGREGVRAILDQFLPDLDAADRKVPKLEALGKHDKILAAVEKAMSDEAPADAVDNDDPFA